MSSPIAIPFTNTQRAQSPNGAARSLPGNASGLYVPVHRRGASTSSTSSSSSFSEHGSLSPVARTTGPRTRSVSPMPHKSRSQSRFGKRHLDVSPMPSPRSANIPLTQKIPNTYTITELLALSSSPAHFTPAQRAQIDAHIPFMTRKRSSKASSSTSSSPATTTSSLPAPTPAPVAKSNADAQKPRRRRPGRKNSSGKPRVAPAVGTDVENRRRRHVAHSANWGWTAHAGSTLEQDSWRAHALPVAA